MIGRECKINLGDEDGNVYIFRALTTDYVELRDGVAQFPAAVLEDVNTGQVRVFPAYLVQFVQTIAERRTQLDAAIKSKNIASILSV